MKKTDKNKSKRPLKLPIRTWARYADHLCLEDPTDRDNEECQKEIGMSPLHQAAFNGSVKNVKKLLAEHVDINIVDNSGWRPLHDAAMRGHAKIVKLLLAAEALTNVQDNEDMYTPLHDAVRMNHPEIVKLLLHAGADRSIKDGSGATPLDIAQEYNFKEIIDLLGK